MSKGPLVLVLVLVLVAAAVVAARETVATVGEMMATLEGDPEQKLLDAIFFEEMSKGECSIFFLFNLFKGLLQR